MRIPLLHFIISFCFPISIFAQFDWQHTNGPEGGRVLSFYTNDDYTFYSDEYNVYRTADGSHWEIVAQEYLWPVSGYNSTLVAQGFEYDDFNYFVQRNLLVSYDDGVTWIKRNFPQGKSSTSHLAMCSHGLYISDGANHILYRSQDDGQTWDALTPPTQYGYELTVFEERLYLSNLSHLWRSDTNGNNWDSIGLPLATQEYIRDNIFAYQQHIIVPTSKNVWHSHDEGQTWSITPGMELVSFQNFARVGTTVYALGGSDIIFRTNDFGITWDTIFNENYDYELYCIGNIDDKVFLGSWEHGMYRWDVVTQSLVLSNSGLYSSPSQDIEVTDDNVWAVNANGVFRFDRQQQLWDTVPALTLPVDGPHYHNLSVGSNGLMALFEDYTTFFYLSQNYGQTWDSIPLPTGWPFFTYVDDGILIDGVLFAGQFTGEVYRSADLGQTWQSTPFPAPVFLPEGNIDIVKHNGNMVTFKNSLIVSSADKGITWDTLTDFNAWVLGVYSAGDRLFALVNTQISSTYSRVAIYTSTDGTIWKYANDGIPDFWGGSPENIYNFFGHEGTYFYYDPAFGFFASTDTCKTWAPVEQRGHSKTAYDRFHILSW